MFVGVNVHIPYPGAGSEGRASSGTSRGRPKRRAAARGEGSVEKTARITPENIAVARGWGRFRHRTQPKNNTGDKHIETCYLKPYALLYLRSIHI